MSTFYVDIDNEEQFDDELESADSIYIGLQTQLAESRDVRFLQPLTEPLRIGSHIVCTGTPDEDLPWFTINIGTGGAMEARPDVAVHFNVRMPQRYVVRNTRRHARWGPEENTSFKSFPFKFERPFTIEVIVDELETLWAVDGAHYCSYAHRNPSPFTAAWVQVIGIRDASLNVQTCDVYPMLAPPPLEVPKRASYDSEPDVDVDWQPNVIASLENGIPEGYQLVLKGRLRPLFHSFTLYLTFTNHQIYADHSQFGHICRRTDDRWGKRVLEWSPRLGKRSVGRPPARWGDDLRKLAIYDWMRQAKDRIQWRDARMMMTHKNFVPQTPTPAPLLHTGPNRPLRPILHSFTIDLIFTNHQIYVHQLTTHNLFARRLRPLLHSFTLDLTDRACEWPRANVHLHANLRAHADAQLSRQLVVLNAWLGAWGAERRQRSAQLVPGTKTTFRIVRGPGEWSVYADGLVIGELEYRAHPDGVKALRIRGDFYPDDVYLCPNAYTPAPRTNSFDA
ncbi:unnamed protein product [Plutella xylostella]|uniref:Galectin n=1 Tax=Plutella xylostella TaxID=51655 RepID=A0A8S4EUF6_PLUXY|nr:unnamed protein product [Plutella xylostella]